MPTEKAKQPLDSTVDRCDICGEVVDMSKGDQIVLSEFGPPQHVVDEHGIDPEEAIEAVADTLEREVESPEGHALVEVIREHGKMFVHQECLDSTNYSVLEVPETLG